MPRQADPSKALLWQKRLADFHDSQLTVPQFCQSIGCSVPTFYHWKRKLQQPVQPSAFLRVQTTDSQPTCIEVRLPSGITLRVPLSSIDSLVAILKHIA